MYRSTVFIILSLLLTAGQAIGQQVTKIGVPELEKILTDQDDTLNVINFWATWCPPCISELPHFEKLSAEYRSRGVRFILVSLDFPSQIESSLLPFLRKHKITAPVMVMTNLDYNSWIDKVDNDWQGNLPATLFFNNSRQTRLFYPAEMDENELRELIEKNL